MLKSRILGGLAVAALAAGIAATTATNGAELSPAEEAATIILNKKIADDNAALDASEKAKQEAYEQQVKQSQAQYEEQKAAHQRQLEEQKAAYEREVAAQKAAYQRQLEQYSQQFGSAGANPAPAPSP
jgi:uncharacterized protein YlxW (UPF0749 family)